MSEHTMKQVDWLNRLAKWRNVLAGWQLGTRVKGDPEGDAVREHREATLLLRAELNALVNLLIDKGNFTEEEFRAYSHASAETQCSVLEERFPGFRAVDNGIEADARIEQTMKGWKP